MLNAHNTNYTRHPAKPVAFLLTVVKDFLPSVPILTPRNQIYEKSEFSPIKNSYEAQLQEIAADRDVPTEMGFLLENMPQHL